MQVHELAPAPGANKGPKRVGRGIAGKGGKTAGRGTKGQRSRGRGKVPRGFEGGQMPLKQRVPKLKGFNNPFRVEYAAVNLDTLEELLGRGELTRKLAVEVHAVSKSAETAIAAAGGSVTLVPLPFQGENKAGRPAAKGNQFTNG